MSASLTGAAPYASPLFWPLAPWLAQLPGRPDAEAIARLAERHPRTAGNGRNLRFVPPRADGLAYECRVWETGHVETRPDNWHDFFNAIVWFAFPETKQAITAAHVNAMQAPGERRSPMRDALTHFDECGIAVLASNAELLDLLRNFRWKELFVERRSALRDAMRFIVFGHATYEALLAPFRGLTAKAMLLPCDADTLALPDAALTAEADRKIAENIAAGRYTRPRDFQPLPLLGIPGVVQDNEDPLYYDDPWQFRPGRRKPAA